MLYIGVKLPGEWFLQTSGTTSMIKSVFFTTSTVGWASVSSYDTTKHLLYTSNGGASWSPKNTGVTDSWNAMYFISSSLGYLAGHNGKIVKVTKPLWGSYEFTLMDDLPFTINDIFFINSSTGWAVGSGGKIYKTVKSGSTWTAQTSNIENSLHAVYFVDSDYGWAVGDDGTIVHTTNGGTTWSLQTSPHSSWQYDVQFFDRNNGWIAANTKLLHTTNGGATWTYVNSSISTNLHMHFTDTQNGWVCGNWGNISHTNDGGQTWYTQNSNTDASFLDMFFYDSYTGWAVGGAGKIIKTTTGGCKNFSVDLGADKEICNGQSTSFSAPSGTGYKYSWNTGATSRIITANTQGTYSVTVTNTCNTSHSDNSYLTVYPLPDINLGDDQAFCQGITTTLTAPDGYTYQWNTGATTRSITVGSTGNYSCTITDNNNCQKADAVYVTVYSLPFLDLGADQDPCEGDTIILDAGAGYDYLWNDGNIDQIRNITSSGEYSVEITDNHDCKSYDTVNITFHEIPDLTIMSDGPTTICDGEEVNLNVVINNPDGISTYTYDWSTGSTSDNITTGLPGLYSVGVTDDFGCSDTIDQEVIVHYSIPEDICIVTIDLETGKNLLVWEKEVNAGVSEYLIYREGEVAGQYDVIGVVPFDDLSIYVDLTSYPESRQYLYKISAVDTCGTESTISSYHKTLFLQYVSSVGGVNLRWDKYEIEGSPVQFQSYIIYRGTDSTKLEPVETISGNLTAWTDTDPVALQDRYYYRIAGVKGDTCSPSGSKKAGTGPYSHSMSNIEDNRLQAAAENQAPTDISLDASSIDENEPAGSLVGRFTTSDPDDGDTHTYGLIAGSGDDDNPDFTITGDSLLTAAVFDYETKNSYSIRVKTTDSGEGNLSFEKSFTISVNDLVETGLEDPLKNTLHFYPNPFTHTLTIEFPNPYGMEYTLFIRDLSGKVVHTAEPVKNEKVILERGNLAQGYYIIELCGDKIYRGKLIVE